MERYSENANQALWNEVDRQMIQQHGYVQEHQLTMELFRVLLCKAYVEKTAPGLSLTMSMPPLLDAAWHVMILNTEMYAAFCRDTLMLPPIGTGGVLPHTTTTDGDELVVKNRRITVTEIMYRAMWTSQGIELAPAFWQREEHPREEVASQKECKHRCKDKTSCKHACCHRGEPKAKKAKVDSDLPQELPETPFQIYIKAIDGNTLALQVSRGMSIALVKRLVQIKKGTPWDAVRLVYAGFNLDDTKQIDETNIRPECTLHLVMRLRGC